MILSFLLMLNLDTEVPGEVSHPRPPTPRLCPARFLGCSLTATGLLAFCYVSSTFQNRHEHLASQWTQRPPLSAQSLNKLVPAAAPSQLLPRLTWTLAHMSRGNLGSFQISSCDKAASRGRSSAKTMDGTGVPAGQWWSLSPLSPAS